MRLFFRTGFALHRPYRTSRKVFDGTSKNGMRAVDTNVLVRLIARDDPRETGKADSFVERGAWVSHLALAEAAWVLAAVHDRTPSDIANAVYMLLNHETLTLQDADVVSAALDHFRKTPVLSFSDCMLLEIARKAGHLPLGTFDRSLGKLPNAERI
jgi:predicted nucleic-acid-binding protein